jgi:hypothetical protein
VLIADFTQTFFLKTSEVLKLAKNDKLDISAEKEDFIEKLMSVDFNNRCDEAQFK